MDWNLFLNTVYVFLTLVLAIVAIVSIRQNQQIRKDMIRPNIISSIETNQMGGLICLVLKNYGGTPAKDIKVAITQEYKDSVKNLKDLSQSISKLEEVNFVLAPNQKQLFVLAGAFDFHRISQVPLEIELVYKDSFNKKNKDQIFMDIGRIWRIS